MTDLSSQLVFPGFRIGRDDPREAEGLVEMGVGGFCVYYGKAAQVAALTRRLQRKARVPLLFCADYEDGIASHVEGGTAFPSNMALGASGREDLAFLKGRLTALEARALGVRWVFAPVLDLGGRADNPIISIRSFGADPDLVSRMGAAAMRGLREGGALSCAKHFPGHGETRLDSHLALPRLEAGRGALLGREMAPFAATARLADSVMLAHLHVPAVGDEPGLPSSLSRRVVGGLLRRRLGYRGVVATDALDMRSVSRGFDEAEAARLALLAGADVLLVPEDPALLCASLARMSAGDAELRRKVRSALERVRRFKTTGAGSGTARRPRRGLGVLGCARHRKAAREMAEASLTWVRPPRGRLPSRVRYSEIGGKGRAFVEELSKHGVSVLPWRKGAKEAAVVASFLGPRAYSGRARYEPKLARRARAFLAGKGTLVSFGSPFIFDQLRGWESGLCAFSPCEASQRAAARALAGMLTVTGRMPVPLACMSRGPSLAPSRRRYG